MIWTDEEARRAERLARKDPNAPKPYIRIVMGASEGRGVKLTAKETWQMANDDAVARVLEQWLHEHEDKS